MKDIVYSILGFSLVTFLYIQSFAAPTTANGHANPPEASREPNSQEGMNAEQDRSNSAPQVKKGVSKNVKGRDGKVPTESSKNAQPSQQKTQERTKSVE